MFCLGPTKRRAAMSQALVGADANSLHGNGAVDHRLHEARPNDTVVAPKLGYGGRVIKQPFHERDDVGEIGILVANF